MWAMDAQNTLSYRAESMTVASLMAMPNGFIAVEACPFLEKIRIAFMIAMITSVYLADWLHCNKRDRFTLSSNFCQ